MMMCLSQPGYLPVASGGAFAPGNTVSNFDVNIDTLTLSGLSVTGNLIVVATGVGENTSGNVPVLSVTRNAVPFIKLSSIYDSTWTGVEIWHLLSPVAGSNNIVVTFTGACDQICAGATEFIGAHASPFGTPVTNADASPQNPATVTFAGAVGNFGFACVMTDDNTSITENGTLLWERQAIGGDTCGGAQYLTGAASMTANWTQSVANQFSAIGVTIKPA